MGKNRRVWLLLAATILVVLAVSPWLYPRCRVAEEEMDVVFGVSDVLVVEDGYVVVINLNVTNSGKCELHISGIEVKISQARYSGPQGEVNATLDESDSEARSIYLKPSETEPVRYVFEPYFEMRPLALTFEMVLNTEEGDRVTIFRGELGLAE